MTIDQDDTTDQRMLVDALLEAGCTVKGANCTCPWHDDETPSAQIKAPHGHWRVTCFKCDRFGDVFDIRARNSGRPLAEELPQTGKRAVVKVPRVVKEEPPLYLEDKAAVAAYCRRSGEVAKWYTYGPKDAPVLIVARIHTGPGKKTFRQFTPHGSGYHAKNTNKPGTVPPYRIDECAAYPTVLIVEGEKACDAAWELGIPATTSFMGAGKADFTDWSPLAGKHVVLWPDLDEVGRKHMAVIAEILGVHGCSLQMIEPDGIGLDEGGDIADLLQAWGTPTEREQGIILTLMADAERLGASIALDQWHEDVFSGKWKDLDWPLASLGRMARGTMPGGLMLLCADPGAGKSWLMLQLMRFWNAQGQKTVVRMFEDDAKAHMARMLAQMTGNGQHTNDRWLRENRESALADVTMHRKELDRLGGLLVPETKELWSHTDLGDWCERHAKAGARVIIADPITAVQSNGKPWLQDFELAMRLKDICHRYSASIILTTHPRGTVREPSLIGMAGGVAWPRFAHCVLWLEMLPEVETVAFLGGTHGAINRRVRILKSRHGKGAGAHIGAFFGDDVNFREVGIISRAKKSDSAEQPPKRTPRMSTPPSDDESVF